jgi:hypothetical protein
MIGRVKQSVSRPEADCAHMKSRTSNPKQIVAFFLLANFYHLAGAHVLISYVEAF